MAPPPRRGRSSSQHLGSGRPRIKKKNWRTGPAELPVRTSRARMVMGGVAPPHPGSQPWAMWESNAAPVVRASAVNARHPAPSGSRHLGKQGRVFSRSESSGPAARGHRGMPSYPHFRWMVQFSTWGDTRFTQGPMAAGSSSGHAGREVEDRDHQAGRRYGMGRPADDARPRKQ